MLRRRPPVAASRRKGRSSVGLASRVSQAEAVNGTLKRVHSSVHRLGVDGQSQPILPTTSTTAGNRRNMRRAVRTAEGKRTYVLVAQQVEATAQGSLKCRSDSCPRHEAMSFSAWCQRGCRNISLISLSLSTPPHSSGIPTGRGSRFRSGSLLVQVQPGARNRSSAARVLKSNPADPFQPPSSIGQGSNHSSMVRIRWMRHPPW